VKHLSVNSLTMSLNETRAAVTARNLAPPTVASCSDAIRISAVRKSGAPN
jgi:hypothetical protein